MKREPYRERVKRECVELFVEPVRQKLLAAVEAERVAGTLLADGSVLRRLLVALEREELLARKAKLRAFASNVKEVDATVRQVAELLATDIVEQWVSEVRVKLHAGEDDWVTPEMFDEWLLPCALDEFWEGLVARFTAVENAEEMPITQEQLLEVFADVKRTCTRGEYLPLIAAETFRLYGMPVQQPTLTVPRDAALLN